MDTVRILCVVLSTFTILIGLIQIILGGYIESVVGYLCQNELKMSAGYIAIIAGCILIVIMILIIIIVSLKRSISLRIILLGMVAIVVLSMGGMIIYGWLKRNLFIDGAKSCFENIFTRYDSDGEFSNAIDTIQKKFECCGKAGAPSYRRSILPSTCCIPESSPCIKYDGNNKIKQGCSIVFKQKLQFYFPIILGAKTGFYLVMLTLVILAGYVVIKDSKSSLKVETLKDETLKD